MPTIKMRPDSAENLRNMLKILGLIMYTKKKISYDSISLTVQIYKSLPFIGFESREILTTFFKLLIYFFT